MGYRILIDKSQDEIVDPSSAELKKAIQDGDLKDWEFQGMKAIWFAKHLYQPLLYLDTNIVEISPAPLNKGERQFVEDLKSFHDSNVDFFARPVNSICSATSARAAAWASLRPVTSTPISSCGCSKTASSKSSFVDPKGIRNLGPEDPKIRFYETIKEIEQRLGDPGRAPAILYRLKHAVPHDAETVEQGQERNAEV